MIRTMPNDRAEAADPFAPLGSIEVALARAGDSFPGPKALADAMRYALLGGGKRLRPLLSWHSCVAAGGEGRDAIAVGVAVEMVHAFSLVHDDLPALDNDDLRRGRPTLHRHAEGDFPGSGEAMAILAGDALLVEASRVLLRSYTGAVRGILARELAHGAFDMVRGQVYDTLPGIDEGTLDPRARVRRTHALKTGALIAAACRMGAIAALPRIPTSQRRARVRALSRFGRRVGLMYQIVDDLLDVEQEASHAGKRTGKDARAGKLTYPEVLGVEGCRSEITRMLGEARASVASLGASARSLGALAEYMAGRTR